MSRLISRPCAAGAPGRALRPALAVLVLAGGLVASARADEPADGVFVLKNRGIQCVQAPCPVWEIIAMPSCKRAAADSLDFSALTGRGEALQSRLMRRAATVRGSLVPDPNSNAMVFRVLEILGEADPRAADCPPDGGQG